MLENNDRLGDRMDEAQLRYLRAADYAQQGQYAEAEAEFTEVISINPALHTARFQLGLLQLTCAKPDQARSTWAALHQPGVPAELQQFTSGLEALICDDFSTSIALLQSGIALNQTNPALNKDMAMVIAKIEATINAANPATPIVDSKAAEKPKSVRTDFSLYGNKE